jgi:hypothetical protein
MYPRFLITLDEDLEAKPVTVRVGTVSSMYEGVILYFEPVFRLSMSLDKRASRAQFLASRPIRHPYDWQPRNVRSSQRKNTSHLRVCWRGSSCCIRTLAGRRRWSCSLTLHRHGASNVLSSLLICILHVIMGVGGLCPDVETLGTIHSIPGLSLQWSITKFFISTLIFGSFAATGVPVEKQVDAFSYICCTLRYRQLRAMTVTADIRHPTAGCQEGRPWVQ